MTFARRLYKPSARHITPLIVLRELSTRYHFELEYSATVPQVYRISESGGILDLARWCDVAYGERIGFIVQQYLEEIAGAGVSELPNDDHVYVLQREPDRHEPEISSTQRSARKILRSQESTED